MKQLYKINILFPKYIRRAVRAFFVRSIVIFRGFDENVLEGILKQRKKKSELVN